MNNFVTKQMNISALKDNVGNVIGESNWYNFSQERLNIYATLTKDNQWIHTEPARCKAQLNSPTIVQGMFLISMYTFLFKNAVTFTNYKKVIQYGVKNFRWLNAVESNSDVKASFKILSADTEDNIIKTVTQATFFVKGKEKPCADGEFINWWYT